MEDPRVDDEVDEREHQHDAPGGAVRDDDGKRQYAADRDHVPRAGEGQDQAEEGDGSYHSTNLSVEITASNVGSSGARADVTVAVTPRRRAPTSNLTVSPTRSARGRRRSSPHRT